MIFNNTWFASGYGLTLYFLVQLICFFWLIRKYKFNSVYVLFTLIWYPAIFETLGPKIQDYYYALIFIYAFIILIKNKIYIKELQIYFNLILAFSFIFFVSEAINQTDNITTVFSQYSRYFTIFLCLVLVRKEVYSKNRLKIRQFIFDIITTQIIITFAKILTFKFEYLFSIEHYVGSLANVGGAYGTTIPILGTVFLAMYRFSIFKGKEWFYVASLLLLGLVTAKRAVIFLLPITLLLVLFYIPKLKLKKEMFYALLLIPIVFIVSIKLSPSLNPDHKVGGRFDISYFLDYANKYQNGQDPNTTKTNKINNISFKSNTSEIAQGRSSVSLALFQVFLNPKGLNKNDIFGYGYRNMYGIDYSAFLELPLIIQINHKGSATGFFQSYVTIGLIGTIISIIWLYSVFFMIKCPRVKNTMLLIITWDYFLYNGMIIRTPALMFVCAFIIFYSNWLYENKIWLK